MTLIFGGLLAALVCGPLSVSPVVAQSDDPCRNPRNLPTIIVEVEARAERTSMKYTAEELHRYANQVDPLPTGYRHFGFMETLREFTTNASVRSGTDEYKNFCFSPDTITVTVSFAPVIYVPGEYPRTDCPAGAIRLHELRHLDIHEQALRELPRLIRRALEQEHDLRITRKARDRKHAVQLVRDLALRVTERVGRQQDADYRIRHLEMDSPERYRENLSICGEAEWAGLMD